jgi:hypothetical protein
VARLFGPATGRWQALTPHDARRLLESLEPRYWIAGGWAIDLFLGEQHRPHKDLDIGIRRADVPRVFAALPGWDFFEAKDGSLSRLDAGEPPRASVNSLWSRATSSTEWALEFLLDDSSDEEWIFRRDPSIRLPIERALRRDPEGIPYLSPEIQLLYKAPNPRTEDQADFERVLAQLDPSARGWLEHTLMRIHPGHPWSAKLESRTRS